MNKKEFSQIKIEPELQINADNNTTEIDTINKTTINELNNSYFVKEYDSQFKKNLSLNTSKNKIYKCEICEEEFQRSYQLKRHNFVGVHKNFETKNTNRVHLNNNKTSTTVAVTNGHNYGTKNKELFFEAKPEADANGENIVIKNVKPFQDQYIEYEIQNTNTDSGQPYNHIKPEVNEEAYTDHNVYECKVKSEPPPPSKVISTNGTNIKAEPKDIEDVEEDQDQHQDSQLLYKYPEGSSEQDEVAHKVAENNVEVFLENSNKPIYSKLKGILKKRMPFEQYQCDSCSQSFTDLDGLDLHLQQHNGKKYAFKCELCDKHLASLIYLRNHVISHTENKRHKCDVCEVSFDHADLMRNHQVVHKYNVFKCDKCIKSFATKHLYMSHMYKHTHFKPYTCKTCHRSFIHLTVLTKHKESDSCSIYIRRII